MNIGGTDRYVLQLVETGEQTVTIDYDFSQYDGTISRFEVRIVKYSSYTNPVYMDNIRVYPI